MKKIALFIALFAGMFTTATAQEAETQDSLWVVQGDTVATAYAISDGDYISFTKPALWHKVVTDAPTYYYYNSAYTYDVTYKTTIQQLGTQNYFYVENFLNSGSGFYFKVQASDGTYPEEITDLSTIDGIPVAVEDMGTSVTDYGSFSYNYFYTYDATGTATYSWTDEANGLSWDYFVWYGGSGYAEFSGSGKYMSLLCYCSFVSGATSNYSTLYIDWR